MVERLKEAIEKARRAREAQQAETHAGPGAVRSPLLPTRTNVDAAWEALPVQTLDAEHLNRHRIVSAGKTDAAHMAFDLLRTRLAAACRSMGLRRIGITSPSKGCGKSLVSVNLAHSLGRNPGTRTVLIDLDLRAPTVGSLLGLETTMGVSNYLAGETPLQAICHRIGPSLTVLLNTRRVRDSTELLLAPSSLAALQAIDETLAPDFLLYDMPPLLGSDDVLAFLPNVDAILMVAGGGETTAADLIECERLLEGGPRYLGVVLNRAENVDSETYNTYYGEA